MTHQRLMEKAGMVIDFCDLPEGWVFETADCTIRESHFKPYRNHGDGCRVSIRYSNEKMEAWHKIYSDPESADKSISPFITGYGNTLAEAFKNASDQAVANPDPAIDAALNADREK